jgi:hypothetical protein
LCYIRRYGTCDGDASDANFVTRTDEDGNEQVFGSIRVGHDICQISLDANGESVVECVPEADYPEEMDYVLPPSSANRNNQTATRNLRFGFTRSSSRTNSLRTATVDGTHRRLPFDDSGKTIDIMVVWTQQAECAAAYLETNCELTTTTEDIMRGLVDLAVTETNAAFALSGIVTRLRLVHAYRHATYVESQVEPIYDELKAITSSTDGLLDDVHVKRSLYGADAVSMMVGTFQAMAHS